MIIILFFDHRNTYVGAAHTFVTTELKKVIIVKKMYALFKKYFLNY